MHPVLPDSFEENILNLLSAPDSDKMMYLDDMLYQLEKIAQL